MDTTQGVVTLESLKRVIHKVAFKRLFPDLIDLISKAEQKPGCDSCTRPLWLALRDREDDLKKYFGDAEFDIQIPMTRDEASDPGNIFVVADCDLNDISEEIAKLPLGGGPLDITMARYERRVTIIVQEL